MSDRLPLLQLCSDPLMSSLAHHLLRPLLAPRGLADERMHMNMQLRATLEALNARAMVVGHTPQVGDIPSNQGL